MHGNVSQSIPLAVLRPAAEEGSCTEVSVEVHGLQNGRLGGRDDALGALPHRETRAEGLACGRRHDPATSTMSI